MDREILYRGKRIDTGEWVEGYYAILPTDEGEPEHVIIETFDDGDVLYHFPPVDSSTVGQYTGLTDKKGKRIFEGDIVRYTFDSPDDPTATENGLKPMVGRIFWSEWRASFAVTQGRNGSSSFNSDVARCVRGRSIYEYVQGANTVEVIGNIHDNADLLK